MYFAEMFSHNRKTIESSRYTEKEKQKARVQLGYVAKYYFDFFFAFIGVVFLRHHKIMKIFDALNLKVFSKYLLLIE